MAVNSKTGNVYVTVIDNTVTVKPHVAIYGPTVIVPEAITGPATDVTGITATLTGSVDPSGSE